MPQRLINHALLGPLGHQLSARLTVYLGLLVLCGFLRADRQIGLSPLCSAVRGYRVRWRRVLRWMKSRSAQNSSAASLSAIELAVVAELNFELARAYDEVADDANQPVETRLAAHEKATAICDRAASFQHAARRLSAKPMLYAPSMQKPASPRTASERRTRDRRNRPRRRDGESAVGPPGGRERRTLPDRRKRDRRDGGALTA